MHNMIQSFGRKLVSGETEEIESGSRLWESCSIRDLLEDNGEHKRTSKWIQDTEEIEGMFLDTSNLSFDVDPSAFENMSNLRLLKIYCSNREIHCVINFSKGSLHSLPNELRLLHWDYYPLKCLPQNFDPRHLVIINMQYSQLETLWSGTKNLKMLRTIRLCHSQKLVNIDNLQNAQKIEVIDLQGCTKLQSFPATGEMLHLRVLNLSGCREMKSLSEIPPNIEMLHLQGTGIKELPLSIVKPNCSETMNHLAKIPGLSSVSNLESDLKSFINMKMSMSRLDLGKLICLELRDCSLLESLPDMVNLDLLRVLDLSDCSKLQTIQGFPRNLKELNIVGTAVRQLPQLPQSLELFNAHGCFDLSPEVLNDFLVKALANAKYMPREREQDLNEALTFSFCAPSHSNLNSTLHLQPGSSVMTRLDTSSRNSLVGFAMLVEVAFSEDYDTGFGIICVCRWRNKEGHSHMIERNLHCWAPGKAVPNVQNNHMFVFVDINMRPGTYEGNDHNIWGDLVVFEFIAVNNQKQNIDDSFRVARCGVRVINAASGNTSLENIIPVLSLDSMEVSGNEIEEELLRANYDGLQEKDKVIFHNIACLFNNDDVGSMAPVIASNMELDVSSGLKVLADRSLISLSSNGEIVMHSFQRQMRKRILHGQSMVPGSSKTAERLSDNRQSSMLTQSKNPEYRTRNMSEVPERNCSSKMVAASSQAGDSRPQLVFINYYREELRHTFIKHLLSHLRRNQINYFIDDNTDKGKPLSNGFEKIKESAIALVIFSKWYTESRLCIDELVKMKERVEAGELMVIPVYVNVTPTEVKKFNGEFGRGFKKMTMRFAIKPEQVEEWKEAVVYMTRISGLVWNEGHQSINHKHPSDFTDENLAMRTAVAVRKVLLERDPNFGKTEKTWAGEFVSSGILALFFAFLIPKLVLSDGTFRIAASWIVGLLVFFLAVKMKPLPVTTTLPTTS